MAFYTRTFTKRSGKAHERTRCLKYYQQECRYLDRPYNIGEATAVWAAIGFGESRVFTFGSDAEL